MPLKMNRLSSSWEEMYAVFVLEHYTIEFILEFCSYTLIGNNSQVLMGTLFRKLFKLVLSI